MHEVNKSPPLGGDLSKIEKQNVSLDIFVSDTSIAYVLVNSKYFNIIDELNAMKSKRENYFSNLHLNIATSGLKELKIQPHNALCPLF